MWSNALVQLVSVAAPLLALALTHLIWNLEQRPLGWVALGLAATYTVVAAGLWRTERGGRMSYAQALIALLLGTLALVLVLEGDVLFLALATEAAALHLVARRYFDRIISLGAHVLFGTIGLWLGGRLAAEMGPLGTPQTTVFDLRGICNIAVVALAVVSAFLQGRGREGIARRVTYLLLAHFAVLAWLWSEFSPLPSGDAYVTIAWGLYAAGLLVVGLRLDHTQTIRVGMATLFLVVAKLFLVDLSEVEAVWRILLFLGFGGLFLILSYYLQALWRPGPGSTGGSGSS